MDIESNSVLVRNPLKLTFKKMQNRDDLSDVKIFCGKDVFNAHRFLLAACSPYFRSTFRENRCDKLEIGLPDTPSDDLKRVLQYIYEGSVIVKDKDLQGFGELLEHFEMPLPEEMNVDYGDDDDDDSEDDSLDYGSDSSGSDDHGTEIDEFIETIRNLLNELTEEVVEEQASNLLQLAKGFTFRLEALINMILQQVIKLRMNCVSILFSSLVKHMCNQDEKETFIKQVRLKCSQLLKYLANVSPSQRKPLELADDVNSLDKEVIRIETIEYRWDVIRKQRLTHFVAQLFDSNIISLSDVCNIKGFSESFADEIVNGSKPENCCYLEVPSSARNILDNQDYQQACHIEDQIYWLRIENTQHELREFNGIINNEKRKRNRGLKPTHPLRIAREERKRAKAGRRLERLAAFKARTADAK